MPEQTFTDKDFEDAAGVEDGIPDDGEIATEPIKFSREMVNQATRASEIVEINLNTGECRIVAASDTPTLTKKILQEKGAPIQTGKTIFAGRPMLVDVCHGMSFEVQIEYTRLVDAYKDQPDSKETNIEFNDALKRLQVAKMVLIDDEVAFSFQGEPAGLEPIEDCDDLLLEALWTAYQDVNSRIGDDWVHVEVRRGTPLETKLMLSDTFELFPLGTGERILDMPPDDLENYAKRENARRAIKVSSMINKPTFSLNGAGEKNAYPVENLSEWIMDCLLSAYNVVNVPSEGLAMLRRFPRPQRNGKRKGSNS